MAQLLHASATTTARTQADIQGSPKPATALARRYGVNRKTVLKWRRREGVADASARAAQHGAELGGGTRAGGGAVAAR